MLSAYCVKESLKNTNYRKLLPLFAIFCDNKLYSVKEHKMEINITINENQKERCDITIHKMTPEIQKIVSQLQKFDYKLVGTLKEKKYPLVLDEIISIYASNRKVYGLIEDGREFLLNQPIKTLSEVLPNNFIQISNGEIINGEKISHFELTYGGKIKIWFKDGRFSVSSRSYYKLIKEYLGV